MALRLPVNVDKSFASPKLHNRLNQCRAPVDSLKSQGLLLLHWLRSKMNKCSSLQMLQMISKLRQELETALPRSECCTSRPQTVKNLLECCCCEGFMSHPVCIPCGHTVCRSCLNRAGSVVTCPKCNEKHSKLPFGGESPRKTTLILTNLQQKLNPAALSCCRHREEGNKFAQEGDFPLAVEAYDKAADSGIRDHRVYSNRSRAQFAIGSMHKALQDAEICCSLKPFWPKSHYRRAVALEKIDRRKSAAAAFLLCLHLGGMEQSIARLLSEVLYSLCKEQSGEPSELITALVQEAVTQFRHFQQLNVEIEKEETHGDIHQSITDQADFECILCAGLLFNPVTIPCGHSFCLQCLNRTFDYSTCCPICRSPQGEMFLQHTNSAGQMSIDLTLQSLVQKLFPEEYEEKKCLCEAEMMRLARVGLCEEEDIPIFVCTFAWPGISCPLHVFEPRYRLMMRRSVQSNSRRFGMCQAIQGNENNNYVDYGTILFINSLEYTPDGRSLVTTTGERRFKVIKRSSADGYSCAKIQFISDEIVQGKEAIAALKRLQEEVYEHSRQWLEALPVFTRHLIVQNMCTPIPPVEPQPENCPNGPTWVWWFINAVPTSATRKMEFLCCTSLHERLLMLREILPLPMRV